MSNNKRKSQDAKRVSYINEVGLTRRRLIKGAGGAVGLAAAASLGLPAIGMGKTEIEFIQTSCGETDKARAKILVAYASRAGSTGGVADAIGKELCAAGAAADVRLIKQVSDLNSYDAVIIGSPARNERWLKEARDFVERYKGALGQMPVAIFVTCLKTAPGQPSLSLKGPLPDEPVEKKRQRVRAYLEPVLKKAPQVKPLDIAVFAGALDYSKLSRPAKAALKSNGFIEGDFRDWERIRGWAGNIAPVLVK
jgi:menaquinone-dependent protoporphyrinogen oxidase